MVWLPPGRLLVEKVAAPLPLRVPVPRVVLPSVKVTVPVGVPPAEETVAVKVTGWPKVEGVREELTVVLVVVLLTVWLTLPLLVAKLVSPP
jgi:hypothetical protein